MNAFSYAAAGGLVRITLALVASSIRAPSPASRAGRGVVDPSQGAAT